MSADRRVPSRSSSGLLAAFALAVTRFTGVGRMMLVSGTMLLGAMLETAGLILLVPMLGATIGAAPTSRVSGVFAALFALFRLDDQRSRLAVLFGVFALVMMLRTAVAALREVLLVRQQTSFAEDCVRQVVRRLGATRWGAVVRLKQARVTHTLGTDVTQVRQAVRLLQQAAVAVVLLLGQGVAAVVLSPWLALACAALLAGGAAFLGTTLRAARRLGEGSVNINLVIADSLAQYLGGLKLAVSQDLQGGYVAEMEEAVHGLSQRQIAFAEGQAKSQLLFGVAAAGLGAGIAGAGLVLGVAPATLVGFLIVLVRMSGPALTLRQTAQQLVQLLPSYAALRRLEAELVAAGAPAPMPSADPGALPFGRIVLDRVGYRHRDAAGQAGGGLGPVSLAIEPGEVLGIAGPSGAGKTTLIDLLVGLHAPETGRITVAGRPLAADTLGAWRRQLSYVAQDSYLFHDSVRRNLLWADPGANEAALWAALRIVGAEALVRAMPAGLDTVVGERGSLVSGGERQRLALARALVRSPRLLILDEATNAIGIADERALFDRLLATGGAPTILMVTHRPESLALCGRVVALHAAEETAAG